MTDLLLSPAPPAVEAEPSGHPKRWLILAIVLAAECMDLLDGMIVNVGPPAGGRSPAPRPSAATSAPARPGCSGWSAATR